MQVPDRGGGLAGQVGQQAPVLVEQRAVSARPALDRAEHLAAVRQRHDEVGWRRPDGALTVPAEPDPAAWPAAGWRRA